MPTAAQSAFTRARWTEEDARSVLAALDRSEKSVREFAEEHGLDPQRLHAWRRRAAGGDRITFREVKVRRAPSAVVHHVSEGVFESVLPNGGTVRVPAAFDADALARLLDVLGRARGC